MKRGTVALRSLLGRLSAGVGLEGAFLLAGTACLGIFSASISPAGPWLVAGLMATVLGLSLAIPKGK